MSKKRDLGSIHSELIKQIQESTQLFNSKLSTAKLIEDQIKAANKALSTPFQNATITAANIIRENHLNMMNEISNIPQIHEQALSRFFDAHANAISNLNLKMINQVAFLNDSIPQSALENATKSILNSIPEIDFPTYHEIYESQMEVAQDLEIRVEELESYSNLEKYFEELIQNLPKGKVNAQGIFSIISTVLNFLMLLIVIAQYNDKRTVQAINDLKEEQEETNEHLKELNKIGNKIYPMIENLAEREDKEDLYVVKKNAPLRKFNSSDSDTLARVFPNQLLECLKVKKRWIYVRYFDHRKSMPRMGWIYKGHIERYKK